MSLSFWVIKSTEPLEVSSRLAREDQKCPSPEPKIAMCLAIRSLVRDPVPPQQTIGEYGRRKMYGFVAIVFDGKTTAQMALNTLTDIRPAYVWVDDVAVVSRGKSGASRVHCTLAHDDSDVAVGGRWGLLTGGLIGLLFGPGGAMADAAFGGSLGAMGRANMKITLDDPCLDELADALVKDTSALILVGEKPMLADFASAVEPLGGGVFKSDLTEDDITALRKELGAAARPQLISIDNCGP